MKTLVEGEELKRLRALAEAYPSKLLWGSDTPFQSYVANLGSEVLSLRSTYREEVDCVKALPEVLRQAVTCDNIKAFLRLGTKFPD